MPSDSGDPDISLEALKEACSTLLSEIVEDITLQLCFTIHRALKFGYFPINDYIIKDGKYILHNPSSADHNQNHDLLALAASSKKPSHINCPHCKRKLGTNRFAPHLNSCMGEGGRLNKDRNAKRNCQIYESGDDDDDEDYSDSGKKKKKKGRNSKRVPKFKGKSVQINVFLNQKCGVISRKSKSMCNNTLKCSIHSEEQRIEVRRSLIKTEPDSNAHIDVDTVDEGSRSPSPSDLSLCSSTNSTPSIKLEDSGIKLDNSGIKLENPRIKLEDLCSTPKQPRPTPSSYS